MDYADRRSRPRPRCRSAGGRAASSRPPDPRSATGGAGWAAWRSCEDRRRAPDTRGDAQVGPREVHVAGAAVEGHRELLALTREAAQPGQEIHVPGLAAHLAVGDAGA